MLLSEYIILWELLEKAMIEKKESREKEQVIRITDKRKFNTDGSLRDGVKIKKEELKKANSRDLDEPHGAAGIKSKTRHTKIQIGNNENNNNSSTERTRSKGSSINEKELANDDNPASFVNFLSTLATNAAASLGAIPHPMTGQKNVDLETGKYWIDVMIELRDKTKGNLDSKEENVISRILSDLQIQYVKLSRLEEEKLKAQAARKFSS